MNGSDKTRFLVVALAGLLTVLTAAPKAALAAVPGLINFQGKLTDPAGKAVTTAVPMAFRLYTAASGGSPVWTETQSVTPDNYGIYSAMLGEVDPLNISFSTPYWLGIAVGSDSEMLPRYRMVSSPYALSSSTSAWADGADWPTITNKPALTTQGNVFNNSSQLVLLLPDGKLPVLDGSNLSGVLSTGLADGSVTTAKLAANSVTDAKVLLTTGAITSGKFSDARVAISTGAFSGGFNGGSQLLQLDGTAKVPYANVNIGQTVNTVAAGDDSRFHAPVTVAAIGLVPNASGLTLSSQQLNLQPADGSFGGVVTTGAQTFAGAKTFTDAISGPTVTNTINNLLINSGALSGITTLAMANQLTNSYASQAALNLTGAGAGLTFGGTGPNNIVTASGVDLALMPGGTGKVGIGTTVPDAKLHIAGTFKLVDGTEGLNKVLTSDANGLASWQAGAAGDVYLASTQTFTGINIFTSTVAARGFVNAAQLVVRNGVSPFIADGSGVVRISMEGPSTIGAINGCNSGAVGQGQTITFVLASWTAGSMTFTNTPSPPTANDIMVLSAAWVTGAAATSLGSTITLLCTTVNSYKVWVEIGRSISS